MEICPRRFDGDRDACGFVPGFFLNAVAAPEFRLAYASNWHAHRRFDRC